MGFATFGSTLASTALNNAIGLLGDFAPVIAVVFSLAVLGLLLRVVSGFMPK